MSDRSMPDPLAGEAARLLTICNACRYCEGYCAVFPAMERRIDFKPADIDFLANLCHNCAECYYACQYAPPHEFAVNVPKVLAEVRAESYRGFARPEWLARLFEGRRIAIPWIFGLVFLILAVADFGGSSFYAVIPHMRMVAIFLAAGALISVTHAAGLLAFWLETGRSVASSLSFGALLAATRDVLTLKNLGSGGAGCTYPDEHHSQARRIFHHFTFYGFLLCFASTTVAAVYHFSGRSAPYAYNSLPVMLGVAGGIGLLIGPPGLYLLKRRRDDAISDPKQDSGDIAFIALLFLTSATGLLLLALRETAAMSTLLVIHLAIVLCLLLTLPYGKYVHGMYRFAALLKDAAERNTKKN
jgi:citrate/tricarballylate utilization protein